MMENINWFNHDEPPLPDAIKAGDNIYITWFNKDGQPESHPHLWHWCDKSGWIAARRKAGDPEPKHPDTDRPQWMLAGSNAHQVLSRDPLHLEPSVYWPDCCGTHGFIRNGVWEGV